MKKRRKKRARTVLDSRGRLALHEWFAADEQRSQSRLARKLDVSQPLIAQWLNGTARPSPPLREVLAALGVCEAGAWLTPEERASVAALTLELAS